MGLSDDLAWRGLIKDKTFRSLDWLDQPASFYWGVDCSADSMTIGNLAALLTARRLAEAGWQAVLLVGGATTMIGDPGGKNHERRLLPRAEVESNVKKIKLQVARLFRNCNFKLADNYDWFKDLNYLEFLREAGKHFSISELIGREFIAERIGEAGNGISYAEFSYSLIQGYDFWQLYQNHGVILQIGGSDQWGNMLSGVDLIRKKTGTQVQALSMPLVINKSTGVKFGKSEDGAIWLDAAKTSPTKFYQFWINSDDRDVESYFKIFTLLQRDNIDQILDVHRQEPHKRLAQMELAKAVTRLVHGQEQLDFAAEVTKYLTCELPIGRAGTKVLDEIRQALPAVVIQPGSPVIEVLAKTGLAASNSEARRLVESKAVYVNGQKINYAHLEASYFEKGRLMLRRGKAYKDSALVELV